MDFKLEGRNQLYILGSAKDASAWTWQNEITVVYYRDEFDGNLLNTVSFHRDQLHKMCAAWMITEELKQEDIFTALLIGWNNDRFKKILWWEILNIHNVALRQNNSPTIQIWRITGYVRFHNFVLTKLWNTLWRKHLVSLRWQNHRKVTKRSNPSQSVLSDFSYSTGNLWRIEKCLHEFIQSRSAKIVVFVVKTYWFTNDLIIWQTVLNPDSKRSFCPLLKWSRHIDKADN